MLGYKVYFDGKKFTMEDFKTQIEKSPNDGTYHWNTSFDTALKAVEELNKEYKEDPRDMENFNDFTIKVCQECGNYFTISKGLSDWYFKKKLNIPKRCLSCRRKKK